MVDWFARVAYMWIREYWHLFFSTSSTGGKQSNLGLMLDYIANISPCIHNLVIQWEWGQNIGKYVFVTFLYLHFVNGKWKAEKI